MPGEHRMTLNNHGKLGTVLIISLVLILMLFGFATKYLKPGPRPTTSNPKITILKVEPRDAVTTAKLRMGIDGK